MDEIYNQLDQDVKYGRCEAVEKFLRQKGDPNRTNKNGWTLLMAAAFKGNTCIVTLLLDHKANINALNAAGESALSLAAGGGHHKCVKILLECGADIGVRPLGQSLLGFMKYARNPSKKVNQLLIEAEAK